MRAFVSVCIIAVFCVAASLQDTPSTPCKDGPMPLTLHVEGCNSAPCNMYKGTDLIAQWSFAANADAEQLKPRVRATVMGVTVNYPYPEKDACKNLTDGECPLEEGDEVTYNLRMPISKNYPSVRLVIEFSLVDENDNVQVCFKLDSKVNNKKALSV